MTYGFDPVYTGTDTLGYFDWRVMNRASTVLEGACNILSSTYGFSSNGISNTVPKFSTMSIPYSTFVPPNPVSGSQDYFYGGLLHPNGNIYFIPASSNYVLEFNPNTNVIKAMGQQLNGNEDTSDSDQWGGAVLHPNGKIYMAPWLIGAATISPRASTNQWLVVDPVSRTANLISGSNPPSATTGTSGLSNGAVLGPDNKIYAGTGSGTIPPYYYDPITNITKSIGSAIPTGNYSGGCMAPNGLIFWPCNNTNSNPGNILVMDPYKKTSFYISIPSGNQNSAFYGFTLGPDGYLYTIPHTNTGSSSYVLRVDPYNLKTANIGPNLFALNAGSWTGSFLGPDGCIYGVPTTVVVGNTNNVIKINPVNQQITLIPLPSTLSFTGTQNGFRGGVFHPNGKAYFIPSNPGAFSTNLTMIIMDFGAPTKFNERLSRELNKF